jgi:hypothetical protein
MPAELRGELDAMFPEAVEVTRSARVASYRITATGADGEVRAWYQATAYRTSRWHLGEDRWPATWRAAH